MVRVLGNSPERVPIEDLNDIIYYKQLKDYTDQEYEKSRDLKRAINNGKLAIIEFKKIDGPPGPPKGVRLSPEELNEYLIPYSFHLSNTLEIGPYNYLSVFSR